MIANLIALLEKIGPDAAALIEYLVAHKDQIAALVALLMTLFKVQPSKQAVSDDEFVEVLKRHGASTGDAQELLAAIPAE